MPSSADAGTRAWVALAALLAIAACLASSADPRSVDWQPALAWREPWRAWTAALLHLSPLHLAANLAGAAALAVFGWAARLPLRSAVAWAVAWPLTQWGLLVRPDLLHYGGLSGVLHAGVAVAALFLSWRGSGLRRAIGLATLAVAAVKVIGEAPWGPALRAPAGWDIAVAPVAHASGLLAGLATGLAAELLRRASDRSRASETLGSRMQERKTHIDALASSLLVCCCFLWGLNQVAAKAAMPEVPALWQAALRSLGAALLVWAWARQRGITLFARDGTLPGGLLAGVLFAAEFFCIFVGLQYTTASRMVVFIYISPFVVALGMPLISRSERLTALQSVGLVLAFAGVAWAYSEGFSHPDASPTQWIGDGLGVLAGVLWGATTLAIRGSALSQASAEKTLLYQLAISGGLLLVVAVASGAPFPQRLSALAWSSMAFQVVIVSFASYLLWFWLIRHYPATRLASYTMLTPVFGLLLGAWLLSEPVTARLVFALIAVAAGIYLVNRQR